MDGNFNVHYEQAQGGPQSRLSPHQTSPTQIYSAYRSIAPSVIDPALQHHRSAMASTNLQTRLNGSPSPRQVRQSNPKGLLSSPRIQTTGTPTSAVGRAAYSMSPPPLHGPAVRAIPRSFDSASLPSRDVSDSSIDEAYATFILYANPAVPKDVNTSELRRAFRAPPRSDGKSFSIYTLWQLIRKLENKELKTWSQLAIELGVEPPSAEKGQSAQKIQQYAVRLKRWMRAMHVDAFFEYCLGKPHLYYTQLPSASIEAIEQNRDGVPLEEDLALRALMPDWRPKRGRKKVDEKADILNAEEQASKRPRVDTSSAVLNNNDDQDHSGLFSQTHSAGIWSDFTAEAGNHSNWSLTSAIGAGEALAASQTPGPTQYQIRTGGDFRWHQDLSPSGYPRSALTPSNGRTVDDAEEQPRSAIVPSVSTKNRVRRRHGPAVSSAWPSSSTTSSGRQRGRPPASKSLQDGPFSAFPVKPIAGSGDTSDTKKNATVGATQEEEIEMPQGPMQSILPTMPTQIRPGRLQLQVPQHLGGPVRLATPPTVVVNGDSIKPLSPGFDIHSRRASADFFREPYHDAASHILANGALDICIEDVSRAFAARLMCAKLIGRPIGLGLEEATFIAVKVTQTICRSHQSGATNRLVAAKCAFLLGVEKEMGLSTGSSHHVTVRAAFRNPLAMPKARREVAQLAGGSYEYTISVDADESDYFSSNTQIRNIMVPPGITLDVLEDEFEALRVYLKSLIELRGSDGDLPAEVDDSNLTWKQRYVEAQRERALLQEQLRRLKRMMLEVVISGE